MVFILKNEDSEKKKLIFSNGSEIKCLYTFNCVWLQKPE